MHQELKKIRLIKADKIKSYFMENTNLDGESVDVIEYTGSLKLYEKIDEYIRSHGDIDEYQNVLAINVHSGNVIDTYPLLINPKQNRVIFLKKHSKIPGIDSKSISFELVSPCWYGRRNGTYVCEFSSYTDIFIMKNRPKSILLGNNGNKIDPNDIKMCSRTAPYPSYNTIIFERAYEENDQVVLKPVQFIVKVEDGCYPSYCTSSALEIATSDWISSMFGQETRKKLLKNHSIEMVSKKMEDCLKSYDDTFAIISYSQETGNDPKLCEKEQVTKKQHSCKVLPPERKKISSSSSFRQEECDRSDEKQDKAKQKCI